MKKSAIQKSVLLLFLLLVGLTIGASRYKPTVTTSKCVGCNECVVACPVKAISMVGSKAVIDPDKCVGCMVCVQTCSWGAVE